MVFPTAELAIDFCDGEPPVYDHFISEYNRLALAVSIALATVLIALALACRCRRRPVFITVVLPSGAPVTLQQPWTRRRRS